MAKERTIPHLAALVSYLSTGDGAIPDALRADADRAREALRARRTEALAALAPDVQHAVVQVLFAERDADTLRGLEQSAAAKEVRKAAGKALHLLKTKGVKISEAPRGEGFRFRTVEGEEPRSYASLTDPDGDRMIWFGTHAKQLGRVAFQAVVNEVNGMVLFQTFPQMTAKTRRKVLDELEEKKIPVYEVDAVYARWLIEEALRRNQASGTQIPKEYYEAEPYLGSAPDLSSDPHPVYALLIEKGLSGEPTSEELRQGKALLEIEEIHTWQPVGDIVEKLGRELDNAAGGVLVITEKQQDEQVQAIVDRGIREYFTPEVRALWRRRLLDLTQWLAEQGRGPQARAALASAEDLGREESDPALNAFASELFHHFVAHQSGTAHGGAPAEKKGEEEPSGLIVPP